MSFKVHRGKGSQEEDAPPPQPPISEDELRKFVQRALLSLNAAFKDIAGWEQLTGEYREVSRQQVQGMERIYISVTPEPWPESGYVAVRLDNYGSYWQPVAVEYSALHLKNPNLSRIVFNASLADDREQVWLSPTTDAPDRLYDRLSANCSFRRELTYPNRVSDQTVH